MLSSMLFNVSLTSSLAILGLSLIKQLRFWPPPGKKTWQHRVFMVLFRLFLYPLIALTITEFEWATDPASLARTSIGIILFCVGFGLAIKITLDMGWRNAFGEKKGLRTSGWFSRSRNPIYVATWIGLIGWASIANSLSVSILLALWAFLYVLAPFLEEPWLELQYGDAYREYRKTVRRFF